MLSGAGILLTASLVGLLAPALSAPVTASSALDIDGAEAPTATDAARSDDARKA